MANLPFTTHIQVCCDEKAMKKTDKTIKFDEVLCKKGEKCVEAAGCAQLFTPTQLGSSFCRAGRVCCSQLGGKSKTV